MSQTSNLDAFDTAEGWPGWNWRFGYRQSWTSFTNSASDNCNRQDCDVIGFKLPVIRPWKPREAKDSGGQHFDSHAADNQHSEERRRAAAIDWSPEEKEPQVRVRQRELSRLLSIRSADAEPGAAWSGNKVPRRREEREEPRASVLVLFMCRPDTGIFFALWPLTGDSFRTLESWRFGSGHFGAFDSDSLAT